MGSEASPDNCGLPRRPPSEDDFSTSDVDAEWRWQFLRFVVVGCLTAACYAVSLYLLVSVAGLHTGVGAAGAYLAGMLVNYTGHYFWTYRTNRPHWSATKRYLVTNAAFFTLNASVMAVAPALLGIHYAILQLVLVGMIAISTFTIQRLWIFRRQSP